MTQFAELPKIDSQAKTCVRWNPRKKRYELVVGGKVMVSISRLGMSLKREQEKFRAKVSFTAALIRKLEQKEQ